MKLNKPYTIHLVRPFALEHAEDLLDVEGGVRGGLKGEHVEADGLGKGAALADGGDISLLDVREGRGAVDVDVLVPLLVTAVLGDVVEVIPADDNSVGHLSGGDDKALKDAATDGDVSSEGALLVDVLALGGLLGGLESKSDGPGVTHTLSPLGSGNPLPSDEDSILLLVGLLVLVALAVTVVESHVPGEKRERGGGRG